MLFLQATYAVLQVMYAAFQVTCVALAYSWAGIRDVHESYDCEESQGAESGECIVLSTHQRVFRMMFENHPASKRRGRYLF